MLVDAVKERVEAPVAGNAGHWSSGRTSVMVVAELDADVVDEFSEA
jgi:hypothetical protein